jgi:uncharacterized SAM-binding protein YcdF (DUF218 family)
LLGALVAAWLVATAFLFIWPWTDSPKAADAVVVLSGGRNTRLDPALELVRQGVAPVLVISGAGYDRKWYKARRLCANGARGFRVLCFDPKPYSTRGEARAIAKLASEHGWSKVDVVTSRYHVFRARMLVKRCYHGKVGLVGTSYPWELAVVDWLTEWGKLAVQVTVERGC